uniref:Uncharacterized protein n=1 Tax=Oryza punctata TaxID=4537 RepID=A0A0E0JR61_ORYPU
MERELQWIESSMSSDRPWRVCLREMKVAATDADQNVPDSSGGGKRDKKEPTPPGPIRIFRRRAPGSSDERRDPQPRATATSRFDLPRCWGAIADRPPAPPYLTGGGAPLRHPPHRVHLSIWTLARRRRGRPHVVTATLSRARLLLIRKSDGTVIFRSIFHASKVVASLSIPFLLDDAKN